MGAPSSRTQSPAMDYNVSRHPHSLPSLLHCKARLPWRLLEEGASCCQLHGNIQETLVAALST